MNAISPVWQFEIRYSPILNFKQVISSVLTPFIALAQQFHVDNENSYEERYRLDFSNSRYRILLGWDRIVLIYEGKLDGLDGPNSIVQEPFFNLYSKLSGLDDFGAVKDVLLYAVLVNFNDLDRTENFNNFIEKYNNPKTLAILPESNDIGFVLEKKTDETFTSVIHGPYIGIEDLKARNAMPKFTSIEEYDEKLGEMAEIKIFKSVQRVDFRLFKEVFQEMTDYCNKLWP